MSTLARKSKEQLLKAAKEMENKPFSGLDKEYVVPGNAVANTVANAIKLWNRRRSPTTAEDSKPNLKV
jgi:hypothetical protein